MREYSQPLYSSFMPYPVSKIKEDLHLVFSPLAFAGWPPACYSIAKCDPWFGRKGAAFFHEPWFRNHNGWIYGSAKCALERAIFSWKNFYTKLQQAFCAFILWVGQSRSALYLFAKQTSCHHFFVTKATKPFGKAKINEDAEQQCKFPRNLSWEPFE